MTYNGHKNWNHWNVSLWLFNDYGLYQMMQTMMASCRSRNDAAAAMVRALPEKTPDGARYTFTSVRAALVGWED